MFDRDAAREVLRRYYGLFTREGSALDALAGCVRPVSPQTIDRDAVREYVFAVRGQALNDLEIDAVLEFVVPDPRFAVLRAIHVLAPRNPWCAECGTQWPCATVRVLDEVPADV